MVAKVVSWWGSKLGASAAMAANNIPPRRGVPVAWPVAGVGTGRTPIRTASVKPVKSAERRRMPWSSSIASVLGQPHVLKLLVRKVARWGHPVLHLGPVHDVARPPETGDVVRVLQHDLLKLDDELPALPRVERPRLPRVQVVDPGVGEAGPVLRRPGDERREQGIGIVDEVAG